MKCPQCAADTMVTDSRPRSNGVYRRRVCISCGHRCSTHEAILTMKRGPVQKAPVMPKPRIAKPVRQTQQTQRRREHTDYEPFNDFDDDLKGLAIDFTTDSD